MKSMTGYGRGEAVQGGFKVTAEISSVNRKQSEINVNLPRDLEALEPRVRDAINHRIARGRILVKIALQRSARDGKAGVEINRALAKAYCQELTALAKELKLTGPVTLEHLVRIPPVMRTDIEVGEAERFWPGIRRALGQALGGLVAMRTREGKHLQRDLEGRVRLMRGGVTRISRQAPRMVAHYREQLLQRIRSAGIEIPSVEDERLVKEVVYFADRSDITEELTRLQSHFAQFADCLKEEKPVGRTLDFLAQEMNREVNTIGSKAADSQISRDVVRLRAELERFREQVQNVE